LALIKDLEGSSKSFDLGGCTKMKCNPAFEPNKIRTV